MLLTACHSNNWQEISMNTAHTHYHASRVYTHTIYEWQKNGKTDSHVLTVVSLSGTITSDLSSLYTIPNLLMQCVCVIK